MEEPKRAFSPVSYRSQNGLDRWLGDLFINDKQLLGQPAFAQIELSLQIPVNTIPDSSVCPQEV